MRGKFITFEGCDGCGKSSQIRMLTAYLTEQGRDIVNTREPGGTAVSEKIRELILDKTLGTMEPVTEALLYAASRVQHYNECIKPALDAGKLVVCDRFIDSSYAYQGAGRGLGFGLIRSIFELTSPSALPDLTFFINVKPADAFVRKGGIDTNDRIEAAGADFFDKVYNGFLLAAREYAERIVIVEAGGTKFETQDKIRGILRERKIIC